MAKEITKCPVCGTKLKMINGRMTCKDCGYYVRGAQDMSAQYTDTQETESQYTNTQNTGGQYSDTQSSSYTGAQSSFSYDTDHAYAAQPTKIKTAKSGKKKAVIVAVVAAVIAVGAAGAAVAFNKMSAQNAGSDKAHSLDEDEEASKSRGSRADRGKESGSDSADNSDSDTNIESDRLNEILKRPESEFFQQLVGAIWETSYTELSAADYESLTALEIDRYDGEIYYQLNGGETQSLYFTDSMYMDMSDLGCFPGLGYLYLDDDSLSPGDLNGMPNLYAVYSENTLTELVGIIQYPDMIQELGVEDIAFTTTLDGVENFPNLQYLTVDYDDLEQLDALTAVPGLKGLYIEEGDEIVNFGVLAQLTELECLEIRSDELKDLSFVSYMPNLYWLKVEDSQVKDIDLLVDCPNLETVSFIDNYEITDYSVLTSMVNMYDLSLGVSSSDVVLPNLSGMPNLTYLSLEGVRDLSLLQGATGVEQLTMEYCAGGRDLEYLTGMVNLKTLGIHDFASLTESLEPLTRLPALEVLDLSETYIFGNVEEIFNIPTLYALSLEDCQVGIDFDRVPMSDNLEYLYLNDIRVLEDPSYNNGVTVEWSEHLDMFQKFPSMVELYMEGVGIDNIEFVTYMPALEYLNITDNYVTDLTPLEALPDFKVVWCAKNSIINSVSEDSGIEVDMNNYD